MSGAEVLHPELQGQGSCGIFASESKLIFGTNRLALLPRFILLTGEGPMADILTVEEFKKEATNPVKLD